MKNNYPNDNQHVTLTAGKLRALLKKARKEKVSHRTFRQAYRAGIFWLAKIPDSGKLR